jgi:hypothetical protein
MIHAGLPDRRKLAVESEGWCICIGPLEPFFKDKASLQCLVIPDTQSNCP